MEITCGPTKEAANQAKHGLSLAVAKELEWETALVWTDSRKDYGETRQSALVLRGSGCILWRLWIAPTGGASSACGKPMPER